MSLVSTRTRPGRPTSAGVSNASNARMKIRISSAAIAGVTSLSVIRRNVVPRPRRHHRGFLEGRVIRAEHRRQQQEAQRRVLDALHQDHAAQRVHVEHRIGRTGEPHQDLIDRSGSPEDQQEGDRVEHARNAERNDRNDDHQAAQRRVGALDDPGLHAAERQRNDRRAQRIERGVEREREELVVLDQRAVIAQRQLAERAVEIRLVQARTDEKNHRRHDDEQQHQDEPDHERRKRKRRPALLDLLMRDRELRDGRSPRSSNTTRTRISHRTSSGGVPTMLASSGPSSSSTMATAYGTSCSKAG